MLSSWVELLLSLSWAQVKWHYEKLHFFFLRLQLLTNSFSQLGPAWLWIHFAYTLYVLIFHINPMALVFVVLWFCLGAAAVALDVTSDLGSGLKALCYIVLSLALPPLTLLQIKVELFIAHLLLELCRLSILIILARFLGLGHNNISVAAYAIESYLEYVQQTEQESREIL